MEPTLELGWSLKLTGALTLGFTLAKSQMQRALESLETECAYYSNTYRKERRLGSLSPELGINDVGEVATLEPWAREPRPT